MAGALSLLASCSDISESERLLYVKPANIARAILIEDFTGQKCMHCPKAAQEIERLQQEYGKENVIPVAIHAGGLSVRKADNPQGLATEEGETYYKHWNVEAPPVGLIDRLGKPAYIDQWAAKVHERLPRPAQVALAMDNTFADKTCTTAISVTSHHPEDTEGWLQVWVTEDGIVLPQKMPDGTIQKDYVHNHVFRKAVNGVWGEKISLKSGDTRRITYRIPMDKDWKAENICLVAFVYDKDGVQQVVQKKIVKP